VNRFTTGERVAGIFSQSWLGGAQVDDAWNTTLGGAVDGVLAEYQVFDQNGVVRLPDHLSFEEGSTLSCAGVTCRNRYSGRSLHRAFDGYLASFSPRRQHTNPSTLDAPSLLGKPTE
jgi:NADPH:quinone reductase-like Zn-dependent oxidoreductase